MYFFTSRCVFDEKSAEQKLKGSFRHPYDPYVACYGNERDWKNSVKFRNFRLIVRFEACGSRILHNVEVKMRSVKFRNLVSKMGSSTVCDRNTQKKTENRNTELKKTGIAPIVL